MGVTGDFRCATGLLGRAFFRSYSIRESNTHSSLFRWKKKRTPATLEQFRKHISAWGQG